MRLKTLTYGIKNAVYEQVNEALVNDEEYVHLADDISWADLNHLMREWEREADRELVEKDHQVLKDLLQDRWQMTKRADASYFMNPHSEVTWMFRRVAELLAEAMGGGTNWLSLLIPSLKPEVAAKYSNSDFKFQDYVITSNLDDLVRINQAFKAKGLAPDLTPSMMYCVVYHDTRTEEMNKQYELPSRNAKQKGLAKLKKASDVPLPVNLSYGEAGLTYLKNECYKRLPRFCATFDNLIKLMAGRLPREEWGACIAGIGDDQLAKLMLNGQTMSAFISTIEVKHDNNYHQAMAYTILSHYRNQRAKEPDRYLFGRIKQFIVELPNYYGLGYIKGFVGGAPDKNSKVDLVDYLLERLCGESACSLAEITASLNSILTPTLLNAANDGVLGSILKPFFGQPLTPAVKEESGAAIKPVRASF